MLSSAVRAVERRGQATSRDSLEVAPSRAGGVRASMGGPDVGVGAQGTDRTVSLADAGYMAIPPASPTLGESVAGVGWLDSPRLGV